ncbi:hypothetical protein ABIE26_003985 [Pedobacter africanus]|uniref:Uncharacterized protein n=1 Tax=Pedobacter africanus TaxID=151894 RepID=A0ACC6L1C5_9SPHI|nr:putative phage abortive infection protein [Pedobacter africanus]MDR6785286.1 hypothetical protein [Pedobacter africanus]
MNDKRPIIAKEDDDFISNNPDGAIKGLALLFIAIGFISFIIKFNNEPKPLDVKQNIPKTETVSEQTSPTATEPNDPVKDYWAINGTIGDFVGGIAGTLFSLSGFALLYLTFKKQTEANVTQLNAYNHDKVEGRFFELIKLHRDNVNEIKFTTVKEKIEVIKGEHFTRLERITYENRHFFVAVMDQFKTAYDELGYLFLNLTEDDIYDPRYLQKLKNNATLVTREIELIKYAKIDILYLIVFFGVGKDGQITIKSIVDQKYNKSLIDKILKTGALKPNRESTHWLKWNSNQKAKNISEINEQLIKAHDGEEYNIDCYNGWLTDGTKYIPFKPYYPNNFDKYYGGHQFRLGHYFRHIFHTISFINDNPELSSEEQYSYIKHLRGQFSTNEQILIFLNSISQLGRIWELEDKKTSGEVERWKQIMSDYMVIKNIPNDEVIPGIKLSDFYPNIVYEGFDTPKSL